MADEFRDAGDVEWARRLYRAAKERGSGKAATALAETYDPLYAAASSRPDAGEARQLYETAVKLGDRSAHRRLQELDAWMGEGDATDGR
jgi:TPR repeat protein